MAAFEQVYQDVATWGESHGIRVVLRRLRADKAGEFNGTSATMNAEYPAEERAYYLVHALGSIVRWSLSGTVVQQLFDELRAAKKDRHADPGRLERAIERYRAFETESSEFAVWLLTELGHGDAVPFCTNFMRADLASLTEFHRCGQAPVWRDFFARWNADIARSLRHISPYQPKSIPSFTPVRIENQEILQEQGGKA